MNDLVIRTVIVGVLGAAVIWFLGFAFQQSAPVWAIALGSMVSIGWVR